MQQLGILAQVRGYRGEKVMSKVVLRSRFLQYRGSYAIYLFLRVLAKVYRVMFVLANDVFVPTLWGAKFILLKSRSFAESKYFTIMFGLVEPPMERLLR
jgi:hypothetical protein